MDVPTFNARCPVGSNVIFTRVDDREVETRATGPAVRYGLAELVPVEGIGLVVLDRVQPGIRPAAALAPGRDGSLTYGPSAREVLRDSRHRCTLPTMAPAVEAAVEWP